MVESNTSRPLLKKLYMATPCNIGWENMEGSNRVRFCGACSRNVYNISDMSSREAELFLAKNGVSVCMRFYQRADGTIITDDCPVGLRKLRDSAKKAWKLAAAFLSFCISVTATMAQGTPRRSLLPISVEQEKSAESLPPLTTTLFDGHPGIRETELLPSYKTITTGFYPLVPNQEIKVENDRLIIILTDPTISEDQALSMESKAKGQMETQSSEVLSPWLTANQALAKARSYERSESFQASNAYYKLVFKFFESFDIYQHDEKVAVANEYKQFLFRLNKNNEAFDFAKDIFVQFKNQDDLKQPPPSRVSGPQAVTKKSSPKIPPGAPIPDNE